MDMVATGPLTPPDEQPYDPLGFGSKLDLAPLSSTFDATSIDRKLQRIGSVEQSWGLPSLPDEVKLDIASQADADEDSVTEFLFGLAKDLNEAVNPFAAQPAQAQALEPVSSLLEPVQQPELEWDPDPNSWRNQLKKIYAGVTGLRAPRTVSDEAVQRFKARAVEEGLLPPGAEADGSWNPAMNSIAAELSMRDFDRRMAGERPGATTLDRVAKFMGDWMTPSGLLHAAVELDLLPDVEAIKRETKSWGDKWRSWFDDPTDLGKLTDAVTGPIDDVVVPIVNDALLLTGVGEVVAFARGVRIGAEAIQAGSAIYRTTRGFEWASKLSHLGKAYDVASEIERFRKASFLASHMQRGPGLIGATGRIMEAWRNLKGVMIAKKATQVGMRLGVAGRVEDVLFNVDGTSAGDVSRALGWDEWLRQKTQNPVVGTAGFLFDFGFAPPSIFTPGAFRDNWQKTGLWLRKSFTEVNKQSVAAIRTAETLRELMANRQAAAVARGEVDDVAQNFLDVFRRQGHTAALREFFGDDEKAGHILTWIMAVAGLDSVAAAKAMMGNPSLRHKNPGAFLSRYHFFRNKLINQLRFIPEGDEGLEELLRVHAFDRMERSLFERKTTIESLRSEMFGPDSKLEDIYRRIAEHNAKRSAHWNELLDNVTEDAIDRTVRAIFESGRIDEWDNFVGTMQALRGFELNGDLNDALFDLVRIQYPSASIDVINGVPFTQESAWALDPLARGPVQLVGRFTLARPDMVTKQTMSGWMAYVRRIRARAKFIEELELDGTVRSKVIPELQRRAKEAGEAFHELDPRILDEWIADLTKPAMTTVEKPGAVAQISKRKAKQLKHYLRWASAQGFDVNTDIRRAKATVQQHLDELDRAPEWSELFDIDANHGKLEDKLRALGERMRFTASEVDLESVPEHVRAVIQRSGYKLVHGVEFLIPDDILGFGGYDVFPLPEITRKTLWRQSLGAFFDRQNMEDVLRLRNRKLRDALSAELRKAAAVAGEEAIGFKGFDFNPEGASIGGLIQELHDARFAILDVKESAIRAAYENGTFLDRLGAKIGSINAPLSVQHLTLPQIQNAFEAKYGKRGAAAIYRAIRQSVKAGGAQQRGLLALEDHIRSTPVVEHALKVLARTPMNPHGAAVGRRLAGAVVGGYGAAEMTGDDPLATGLGVVGGGLAGKRLMGPAGVKVAESALGGAVAATADVALRPEGSDTERLAVALGGAIAGPRVIAKAAQRGLDAFAKHPEWVRYSYLGEGLARLRDTMRFTINPFFDLGRYTEGYVLANLEPELDEIAGLLKKSKHGLPLNMSMRGFTKRFGKQEAAAVRAELRTIAKGDVDLEYVDETMRYFSQKGILGFDTTDWMAAMYGYLKKAGVDPERAYSIARKAFTYGLTGRSAAELSVNFVFFPFSFQKKYLGTIGRFMSNDLSRVAFMHDSLKAYEILDEQFNLTEQWKEHLPLLRQLRKVNALAFGISPGEFGGVNRPIIETALNLPPGSAMADIVNVFLPQGVKITTREESEQLQVLMRRLTPVVRDIDRLLDDAFEQGHVVFGKSHMTYAAEVERGWSQQQALKFEIDQFLKENGVEKGFMSMMRDPDLEPLKLWYLNEKAKIANDNPAWQSSMARAIANNAADQAELSERLAEGRLAAAAGESVEPVLVDLIEFKDFEDQMRELLAKAGLSFEANAEDIPPEIYDLMRQMAIELANRGNGFEKEWRRYWAKRYGPIEMDLI